MLMKIALKIIGIVVAVASLGALAKVALDKGIITNKKYITLSDD